ncbi:MAG: phosphoribosylamine--glycine ligase [Halobacteriales archaeon]
MAESVLLIGGGGREHAIASAVAASEREHELHAVAGNRNPGIVALADSFESVDETDPRAVVDRAEAVDATVALVGPEAPLAAGVSDALERAGVYAFAPSQADARIETDKAWQRSFMREHDISGCPDFETFDDPESTAAYLREVDGDVAVKPTGLTGGKGVRVTGDQLSTDEAVTYVLESGFDEWVVEERLVGEEFTLQAFVADGDLRLTPAVQDHKRAFEGDRGPNTGGMGSYSDATAVLPFMTTAEYQAAAGILRETVSALPTYRGVLYGQFMLTADGPKVVEFNARFGDPEAMNTLPVLQTDFLEIATAPREGRSLPALAFDDRATVCKYAVPEGYPTDPAGGTRVAVDESTVARVNARHAEAGAEVRLFYASVDQRDDGLYTTTSRSFAVVGLAGSITDAEAVASAALDGVGDGLRVRHDVGTDELVQRRIDHMAELRG